MSRRSCSVMPDTGSIFGFLFGDHEEAEREEAPTPARDLSKLDEHSRLFLAALAAPGRMGEAYRRLLGLVSDGKDPLECIDRRDLSRLEMFGPRYVEFAEIAMPDLKLGGWTTTVSSINEAEMIFAYRTNGDSGLQALYIKDIDDFDVVQAAVGFSEVDLHPCHVEGLLDSTALVESADAGLWLQLRESTDEIVQVEMVNALDEPLGAIMHMYYSSSDSSDVFPQARFPPPRRPRRSQNYRQSVTFSPLPGPKKRIRAHFGFIMDMDPRMQSAIVRLPDTTVASLLSKAFSAWPLGYKTFLSRHRKEIGRRERSSVHAPFYALCRAYLEGRAPPNSVWCTRPSADQDEVFFDAEEGVENEGDRRWLSGQKQWPPELQSPSAVSTASTNGPADHKPCDQQCLWERFMDGEVAQDIAGTGRRRPSSVGVSFNDYSRRHISDLAALRSLESNDGWDFRMTHADVDIYTKDVENMPCKCFKGSCKIRLYGHRSRCLAEALKAHANRKRWDDLCLASRVVEEYPPFYSVGHFKFSSGTRLISDREMLIMCHLFFEEDGSVFATSRSTIQDDVPEDPDCVRATLHAGGYIMRPTADGDVFGLTYVGCVEGGGWIPTWVQDMVAWRQPLALARLRDSFEAAAQEGGALWTSIRGGAE